MWERGREGNGEWEEIIGGVYHVEEERQGEREMRSGEETFYRWDKQENQKGAKKREKRGQKNKELVLGQKREEKT